MKQLMRLVAKRLLQELRIDRLNRGALVRLPERQPLVLAVKGVNALLPDLIGRRDRLASSSDSPARTAHNFDEVVVRLSFHNEIHQLPRIGESACDGYFYVEIADPYGGFLDAL